MSSSSLASPPFSQPLRLRDRDRHLMSWLNKGISHCGGSRIHSHGMSNGCRSPCKKYWCQESLSGCLRSTTPRYSTNFAISICAANCRLLINIGAAQQRATGKPGLWLPDAWILLLTSPDLSTSRQMLLLHLVYMAMETMETRGKAHLGKGPCQAPHGPCQEVCDSKGLYMC